MYSFRVPKANKSYCSLSIYYALYMHYLIKFSRPSIIILIFIKFSFLFFFFCCTFGMWDLSSPTRDGNQPPALEGRVLTTGPPGKSAIILIFRKKKKNCFREDSVQFSSVAQSCPTLCDPMNCSMPGLPVYHQLPEFTQTHIHRVSDAIQPSHPLSSPSPPAPNPSQHQSLFQ